MLRPVHQRSASAVMSALTTLVQEQRSQLSTWLIGIYIRIYNDLFIYTYIYICVYREIVVFFAMPLFICKSLKRIA